ncbi:MAG: homoserine O-succinyltransferase [Gammaproteobacteria bacterium]|nr:homoserine O-succinyltransferase [Gammaproteobacteria bacterium]
MPLTAHSNLPSFSRLREEGLEVLSSDRAQHQDIRELHIGILNMMPDAALQSTERQFMRLVGSCNRIAQFHVHIFSFPEIPRDELAQKHIDQYYASFDQLKRDGLDALIISGANPVQSDITQEPYWEPLAKTVAWAKDNVCSVMCSCLATHAIVQQLWGLERYRLPAKRWGVYSNRVTNNRHPLTVNINTRFDAPHSHVYEVSSDQFKQAGLTVLAESEISNLHLGTSPDGFRFIFFQGHPEYDTISLLKEYKREVVRFINGVRNDYPDSPENYFNDAAIDLFKNYQQEVISASGNYENLRQFPEAQAIPLMDNTWTDTGKAIFNEWLGLVYQLTNQDRRKVFMEGIDASDPLDILKLKK